ncbi:MAG: STY0301 family protein [Bryobacteraceae bacterium]|jgi:hypothetical protein
MRSFPALLMLAFPFWLAAEEPAPLACPATLTPSGAAGQGAAHEFERVNIYNGTSGREEYDLAPDDQTQAGRKITQMWFLKDYRSMKIFVRCRYRGTEAVTTLDVPAKYQRCTFTFKMDKKNDIVGKSEFSCK